MAADISRSAGDPAFCFLLVVWGERYRRYFTDYCLPSLLAPNNIPCIANKRESKFAIATTAEDWAELNKLDVFKLLKSHIEPVLLELPPFTAANPKMMVMSSGHKKLSNYAFSRRVFGINVNPDSIHSDGMIRALQESARNGKKMVVYPGFRFELEGILAELERSDFLKDKMAIAIPPHKLARIAIRNPHPWLLTCNWDNECFFEYPVFHCLIGRSNDLMILHTISMGPIMVDYGAIDVHDDDSFDKWTLDGDYAYSNFGHFDVFSEIEYVDDSDTFMVVSLTPKDDEAIPQKRVPGGIFLRNFYKGRSLWRVYSDPIADPLKKRLYLRQVVFHANDLGKEWKRLAMRDRRIQTRHILVGISDREILAYASKYSRGVSMAERAPLAAYRVWARCAHFATRVALSCYRKRLVLSIYTNHFALPIYTNHLAPICARISGYRNHLVYQLIPFYRVYLVSQLIPGYRTRLVSQWIPGYRARLVSALRRIVRPLGYFWRIVRLLGSYARVTRLASLGKKVEIERIRRRIRHILHSISHALCA
jgi:hypothetical protein